jgi:hypothetical protein
MVLRDALTQALQGLPLEVLHREKILPAFVADLDGLDDVRVIQARGEARLFEEHHEELLVVRQRRPKDLDDHQLAEARGALRRPEVDVTHAPVGELGDQPIASELDARLFQALDRSAFPPGSTVRRP